MRNPLVSRLKIAVLALAISAALDGCDSGIPEHTELSPITKPTPSDSDVEAERVSAVQHLEQQINQKLINDSIKQWNTAVVSMPSSAPESFSRPRLCVQAEMVVAAYLRANRADGVTEWTKTVQQYCAPRS
jgi:hypothetical protein